MGAAAGKNLQNKELENQLGKIKKSKVIGNVEIFGSDDYENDDESPMVDNSFHSNGSPRSGLSPNLFHKIHRHENIGIESQNNSPSSRLSVADGSPTLHSKIFTDFHDDNEKSIVEISNFEDEEEDRVLDENLRTVTKYIDENRGKSRRRRVSNRSKRSPVNSRINRMRSEENGGSGVGFSEVDEDETTSVLSYDIGDDDYIIGEEEDKHDSSGIKISKYGSIFRNPQISPSNRKLPLSPSSHLSSPTAQTISSATNTLDSPIDKSVSSFTLLPRIKEASSEEKHNTLTQPSSSSSSSSFSYTTTKPNTSTNTTIGIKGLMKESYNVLLNLESIPSNHTKSNQSGLTAGTARIAGAGIGSSPPNHPINDMTSSTTSLQSQHNYDPNNPNEYFDKKNATLLGLQRQKIWSYAHNAQLEREVQALQRQLADLDNAIAEKTKDFRELESTTAKIPSNHNIKIENTTSPSNTSPRHRRILNRESRQLTNDRTVEQSNDTKQNSNISTSHMSNVAAVVVIADNFKKNVASIRARANQRQGQGNSQGQGHSHGRGNKRQISSLPVNGSHSDDGGDSDNTNNGMHRNVSIVQTQSSIRKDTKTTSGSDMMGMDSLDEDESGESDIEMSHSSIVDIPLNPIKRRESLKSLTKASSSSLSNHPHNIAIYPSESKQQNSQSKLSNKPIVIPEYKPTHSNVAIHPTIVSPIQTHDNLVKEQSSRRIDSNGKNNRSVTQLNTTKKVTGNHLDSSDTDNDYDTIASANTNTGNHGNNSNNNNVNTNKPMGLDYIARSRKPIELSSPLTSNLSMNVNNNTNSNNSNNSNKSSIQSKRASLRVRTNILHDDVLSEGITCVQSQPVSTTNASMRRFPKATRSNSGLTTGMGTESTNRNMNGSIAILSSNEIIDSTSERQHQQHQQQLSPRGGQASGMIQGPPSPRFRSDQNKDVLRRVNRRQRKSNLDSESDVNSASEDESGTDRGFNISSSSSIATASTAIIQPSNHIVSVKHLHQIHNNAQNNSNYSNSNINNSNSGNTQYSYQTPQPPVLEAINEGESKNINSSNSYRSPNNPNKTRRVRQIGHNNNSKIDTTIGTTGSNPTSNSIPSGPTTNMNSGPIYRSNPRRIHSLDTDSSSLTIVTENNIWSRDLEQKWHEAKLLLRRRIDSDADISFVMGTAIAGLHYAEHLNTVAKSLGVLRGTISRWILPFDDKTRIDGQCSTPMSVLERMPEGLRGKISDRQIHHLVSGANSVRQLVRIKIADDNDLEQAKDALKKTMDFCKKLQEEADAVSITPYQLLQKFK